MAGSLYKNNNTYLYITIKKMTTTNGLMKPNTKILLGLTWLVIAIIYIADRFWNGLDIRLIDWIGWFAMFTAGVFSIIEGTKIKKNNHK